MNATIREAVAGHRRRTRTEIMRDLLSACRRLGDFAALAELELREPNIGGVENAAAGLTRTLVELRAGSSP